jgi:tRNA pseudouridine65 synthase
MKVLFHDEHLIAVDKPAGYHVHPHEMPQHRVSRDKICLYHVRRLAKKRVYPVHRLDAGTCGVLLFALSSDDAREMCALFNERKIQKKYQAVVRGFTPLEGNIDLQLELDSTGTLVDAMTRYQRKATVEFPVAIGNRFPTSRYSLVDVEPATGRFHQIRRHFNRIAHPLLGDAEHGDSRHNTFFRNRLGIEGLCLKAHSLQFTHPWTKEELLLEAPDSEKWKKIHLVFDPTVPLTEKLKSL